MKIFSIALATTLTGVFGFMQPTLAQPYDQSGESTQNQPHSQQEGQYHGWQRQNGNDRGGYNRSQNGDEESGIEEAQAQDEGGMHNAGAHFRFRHGDDRIDIRCPSNATVEQCVRAAGELMDKVTNMKGSSGSAITNPSQSPGNTAPSTRP